MTMQIDLIVRNAAIVTMDDAVPRAHALAVHHGRVLALNAEGSPVPHARATHTTT
jgi:predicted amidohydrolase YtcJ